MNPNPKRNFQKSCNYFCPSTVVVVSSHFKRNLRALTYHEHNKINLIYNFFPDWVQDLPGGRERGGAERAVLLLPTQRRKPQMRR
jgi:hypothetical protein